MGCKCNLGKLAPDTPNHGDVYTESIQFRKSSALHFKMNEVSHKFKDRLNVELYQYYHIWGIRAIWGYWIQIFKIMGRDTQKVIHSLQLQILHLVWSYSNVKAIWGLSYTYFRVFGAFGQFRKLGPSVLISGSQSPDFFIRLSPVIFQDLGLP